MCSHCLFHISDLNSQTEDCFVYKSAKNRKRKLMSQLVQLRLYSRAQYALCGCQHSEAPDAKQRSFLCKSLGWQAGGLLCVTWPLLWQKFLKLFFFHVFSLIFPSNICAPSVQAAPSLYGVLKVPFLGRQLSALRAFHPVPCFVQEGPTSWMDAAYWICSFATWRRTGFHGVMCVSGMLAVS